MLWLLHYLKDCTMNTWDKAAVIAIANNADFFWIDGRYAASLTDVYFF